MNESLVRGAPLTITPVRTCILLTLPSGDQLPCSGPIQWARGDVGLKPSAAARPRRPRPEHNLTLIATH